MTESQNLISFVETIYELNVVGCVGRQKPTMTGIDDDGWAKVGALVVGAESKHPHFYVG